MMKRFTFILALFFFQQMDFAAYDNIRQTSQMSYLNKHRTFVEKVLGFKAGERGVICNGKVSIV